ncbi:retron St85 family effector protein [Gallaecimonas mangrovi]|uniref:retron St85 family effector protein n=1 Tax=Gallaecimonas mangrovi TaxID=2291597 RepID=UPI000E20A2D0|nr:retron St85 family effector protein [Gallaecimonas mangrovi]
MFNEIKTKNLIHKRVEALKRAIINSRVYLPPDISKFIFLCGANKSQIEISERRKALIEFSKIHLPHTHFFLAEKMFSTLQDEGHKGNILDVESLISDFSDFILIILESPSAFAELGAFSHEKLRRKLVVINNLEFKTENSFINLGPIKAIEEAAGTDRIVYYKMSADGIKIRDAIGDTFHQIYELFKEPIKSTGTSVDLDVLNPAKKFDKRSAMFIHDLIYLSGPILHRELIQLLKLLFGDDNYNKAAHLLAILSSFESIERNQKGLYRSKLNKTYYDFRFDTSKYISTFRNYTLKGYPERLYAY